MGVEPTRKEDLHRILSPARLPLPPSGRPRSFLLDGSHRVRRHTGHRLSGGVTAVDYIVGMTLKETPPEEWFLRGRVPKV